MGQWVYSIYLYVTCVGICSCDVGITFNECELFLKLNKPFLQETGSYFLKYIVSTNLLKSAKQLMEIGLEISPSCRTLCPASTPAAPIPLSLYHLSNGEGLYFEIRPLKEVHSPGFDKRVHN